MSLGVLTSAMRKLNFIAFMAVSPEVGSNGPLEVGPEPDSLILCVNSSVGGAQEPAFLTRT